ncbi:MAG: hypothetical protein V7722_04795 [Porticoccus sp.]
MNSRASVIALPFWLWGAVFVIALLAALFLSYLGRWFEDQEFRDAASFNTRRLNEAPQHTAVTVIGSSLVHRAFFNDETMQQKLKAAGVDSQFVRITASSADRTRFEKALPLIADAQPRLVIVELEMLIIDRFVSKRASLMGLRSLQTGLSLALQWFKNTLFYEVPPRFNGNYGVERNCNKNLIGNESEQANIIDRLHSRFLLLSPQLPTHWQGFIASIQASGGRIIFLEMGRSSVATQGLSENYKQEYEQTLKELKTLYPVDLWRFPGPFPLENYCDLAHLNNLGRERFLEWFIPRLGEALND